MGRNRMRRWIWLLAVVFAVLAFLWLPVVQQETLSSAVVGAIIGGFIPLFVGAWLLFTPSASPNAPLRFLGSRPPTIEPSNEPEKEEAIHRPRGIKQRP